MGTLAARSRPWLDTHLPEGNFVFLPEFLQPWKVYAGPKPVPGLISIVAFPCCNSAVGSSLWLSNCAQRVRSDPCPSPQPALPQGLWVACQQSLLWGAGRGERIQVRAVKMMHFFSVSLIQEF